MAGRSITVTKVGDELANAMQIREALAGDDPQLVLDMIEGSTNLHEAICVVLEEIGEDEILLTGLKAHLARLGERKQRLEKSIEGRRAIITAAMDKATIPGIKSPTGTLSVHPTAPKLLVHDESQIPTRFFLAQDPKLDTHALKAALDAKEEIAGAGLSNGGISLTIRRA